MAGSWSLLSVTEISIQYLLSVSKGKMKKLGDRSWRDLGPKSQEEQDGVGDGPTTIDALSVVGGMTSCQLTISGVAAPCLIIDQLNFTCPAGIPQSAPVAAALPIADANGTILPPAPATVSSSATE
jgi:hypothetical protein